MMPRASSWLSAWKATCWPPRRKSKRLALLHGKDSTLDLETLRAAVADSARFDAFRLTELTLTGQAGGGGALHSRPGGKRHAPPMIVFALAR